MDKNIEHKPSGSGGSFQYVLEGNAVGEMHYRMNDENTMTIDHTEVDEKMEGQGIGKQLLGELVEYVREHNVKVIPQCTFAHVTFKRMKEWQDVLVKPASD